MVNCEFPKNSSPVFTFPSIRPSSCPWHPTFEPLYAVFNHTNHIFSESPQTYPGGSGSHDGPDGLVAPVAMVVLEAMMALVQLQFSSSSAPVQLSLQLWTLCFGMHCIDADSLQLMLFGISRPISGPITLAKREREEYFQDGGWHARSFCCVPDNSILLGPRSQNWIMACTPIRHHPTFHLGRKVQKWYLNFKLRNPKSFKTATGLLPESSWSRCWEWTNRTYMWRSWKNRPNLILFGTCHGSIWWSFRNSYIVTCTKRFWGLFFFGSVLWQAKDKGGCILFKGICTSLSAFQTGVWSLSK